MYSYEQFVTDVAFWRQVRGDAKRTVICEPHLTEEIRRAIEREGLDDILTVRESRSCPNGMMILIDEGAIEASSRQMTQSFMRDPWGWRRP